MRHLMSPLDFSVEELDKLLDLANDIEAHPEKYAHKCDGKKLATCFYEPSTRTRLSFEAAMLNLGGSVLGFHSADSSSASKGESVSDTIRVISCYADICAMRHPKEGAPLVASESCTISKVRNIRCPHCHKKLCIDLEEFQSGQTSDDYDSGMGEDIVYYFDSEDVYECPKCGTIIQIKGWIREYPLGAYDSEEINVSQWRT